MKFFLRRPIGDGTRQAVHLPNVPDNDVDELLPLRLRWLPLPAGLQILLEGHQQIDAGNQHIIPLELKPIGHLKRPDRPLQPFRLILRVLIDHTQLSIQQADALGDRDHLARLHIIAADQIGCLAAGDLQPLGVHILFPVLLRRENHRWSWPALAEEHLADAEPHLVCVVVHFPADPKRGEHLRVLAGPFRLLLHRFPGAGLDDTGIGTSDQVRGDCLVPLISRTEGAIGIGRPHDVLFCGLIG